MSRALRVWNGGGLVCRKPGDPLWDALPWNSSPQAYVAAFSRADARRVIQEYCGSLPSDSELRDYWAELWGEPMSGVSPERGLWLQVDVESAPVRVL